MLGKLLSTTALLLAAMAQLVAAERPSDSTICDYYAKKKYGDDSMQSQRKLMTSIVAFAYGGGENLANASAESKGIFRVGVIDNQTIFLRPYFDGSMNTTNLNDQPVSLNWLDGGGVTPLYNFLNGTTPTADIKPDTNQYRLFTHWYVAFGRIYGCTKVEDFIEKKYRTLMPAYVHKYMGLDNPKIAYFIRQLILASKYYGFSDADANNLEQLMNTRYNIRCAPAEKNMLNSICFAPSCSLALPKTDCDAYKEIKPYGVDDNMTQTPGAGGTSSASPTAGSGAGDKSDLGGGAIAGIVVGALAGVGLVIGALWFFFKKKNSQKNGADRPESIAVSQATGGYHNPSMYSPTLAQSHFDMGSQYGANSQAHYDPNRQSQFTYFSSGHDSHMGASSPPPPQGWVEFPPQELHGSEIMSPPTSPVVGTASVSQDKSEYKPDLRQLVEMESPHPPQHSQVQGTPPPGEREKPTAPESEQRERHH